MMFGLLMNPNIIITFQHCLRLPVLVVPYSYFGFSCHPGIFTFQIFQINQYLIDTSVKMGGGPDKEHVLITLGDAEPKHITAMLKQQFPHFDITYFQVSRDTGPKSVNAGSQVPDGKKSPCLCYCCCPENFSLLPRLRLWSALAAWMLMALLTEQLYSKRCLAISNDPSDSLRSTTQPGSCAKVRFSHHPSKPPHEG
jgi:hypothetical protein